MKERSFVKPEVWKKHILQANEYMKYCNYMVSKNKQKKTEVTEVYLFDSPSHLLGNFLAFLSTWLSLLRNLGSLLFLPLSP